MLNVYVANAFASGPFTGNPAAVVPYRTADGLTAARMQAIAEQHNLAETAFVHLDGLADGGYPLRWFTPAQEVRLCGHATLASAFVLQAFGADHGVDIGDVVFFDTLSGRLGCSRGDGGREMDFPADTPQPAPELRRHLQPSSKIDLRDGQVFRGTDDALLVLDSATAVRDYAPDGSSIRALGTRGLIVTAACDDDDEFDVISRCFYPEFGIEEDAATGSAHTLLGAYWTTRLGQPTLRCLQASRRRGVLSVRHDGGARLQLSGEVELYLRGVVKW